MTQHLDGRFPPNLEHQIRPVRAKTRRGELGPHEIDIRLVALGRAISNWMDWVLVGIAVLFFVAWIILRVILAFSFGILNLLWMFAILFLIIWGVQRIA